MHVQVLHRVAGKMPPEDLLAELVQCIDRFIVQGHWDDGPVAPVPNVTNVTVECLPWDAGGLNSKGGCGRTDAWAAGQGGGTVVAPTPPHLEGADAGGIQQAGAWTGPCCPGQPAAAPAHSRQAAATCRLLEGATE